MTALDLPEVVCQVGQNDSGTRQRQHSTPNFLRMTDPSRSLLIQSDKLYRISRTIGSDRSSRPSSVQRFDLASWIYQSQNSSIFKIITHLVPSLSRLVYQLNDQICSQKTELFPPDFNTSSITDLSFPSHPYLSNHPSIDHCHELSYPIQCVASSAKKSLVQELLQREIEMPRNVVSNSQ